MSIDLGDVYELAYDHYVNGSLASATAATWTVTRPDGTTSAFAATTTATGLYRDAYEVAHAGRHTWRWEGTGSSAGAQDGAFNVRPATPLDVISLANAKRQLNIAAANTAHDEELRAFIEALTAVIEGPDGLGRAVVKRTVVESRTFDQHTSRLALHTVPVIALTSITDLNGSLTWDVADFHVDPDTGVVTMLAGGTPLYGLVQLTYTAGYEVIPGNVAMAARMTLQDWWRSKRADGGGPRYVGGADENAAMLRSGSVLPSEARQMLGPPLIGIG